jgi:AcrR family transcriptional regulator
MPRRPATAAKHDRYPRGQGEQLRADLIDAAIEMLAEGGGIEAVSVRAVTARAGVTATALYLHFGDKEQLLDAVKDRCFGELRRFVLDAEQRTGPDPRAQADAMCLAYLAFAEQRPGYYRVLFHNGRGPAPAAADTATEDTATEDTAAEDTAAGAEDIGAWPQSAADAFGDLLRGVSRCLTDERDPFEVATLVWAGLHGLIGLRAMRHFPFPPADRYVKALLDAHLSAHPG